MLLMIHAQIAQHGSRGQGSHVLSPRIREDEPFRMTIESGGQAYTFEGYLSSTEINMEQDHDEIDPVDGWRAYRPGIRRTNITLEIVATGPVLRELVAQRAKRNVQ